MHDILSECCERLLLLVEPKSVSDWLMSGKGIKKVQDQNGLALLIFDKSD